METSPPLEQRWDSDPLGADIVVPPAILDVPVGPSDFTPPSSQPDEGFEVEASLLELPDQHRDVAIEVFLNRRSRPPIPSQPVLDEYKPCRLPITEFNKVFPLGKIFRKWKHGIPIWTEVKHSAGRLHNNKDPICHEVISRLLKADIIKEGKRTSFVSDFFLVGKDGSTRVRPIFNYSHLTKKIKAPHFVLPSLFQLIKRKPWARNLHYVKFDFASAFFNIPLKEESKHITTFKFAGKFYVLNKLPMGLSLAPYVMQKFLNAILGVIRPLVQYAWGHIDDILLAHEDPRTLREAVKLLLEKLSAVDWRLNLKKSVLEPQPTITFLGAKWGPNGVKREEIVTERLSAVWNYIKKRPLRVKALQRVSGLFNYYFGFAGFYHAVTNRILKYPDKTPYEYIIRYLLKSDFVSFRPLNLKPINAWSDASQYGIAAVFEVATIARSCRSAYIAMNELKAAVLAGETFLRMYDKKKFSLNLFVDNMNVLFLLLKGSCKWTINLNFLFNILKFFHSFSFSINYIPSGLNPADKPSRLKHLDIHKTNCLSP